MYMKMKIQQLEFELESEKLRSRHFEGMSQIALIELQKSNWVNSIDKRNRLVKVIDEVQFVRSEIVKCVTKLDDVVRVFKNILE